MAMLRPDINTWGWSVALWEISALRAFQSSNVAKSTNSRRKILILLRRWLRRYFEIGPGVCFFSLNHRQNNIMSSASRLMSEFTAELGLRRSSDWWELLVFPQQAGVCAPTCLLRVQWEGECGQTLSVSGPSVCLDGWMELKLKCTCLECGSHDTMRNGKLCKCMWFNENVRKRK